MFIERLLILAAATVGLILIALLWRTWSNHRIRRLARKEVPAEVLKLAAASKRSLLYFTTDHCQQCRFQQAPLLRDLAASTDVVVHTIDAVRAEHLTNFYGIMTVPSTIVLDSVGRPVAINHGLASLQRLREQVEIAAAA